MKKPQYVYVVNDTGEAFKDRYDGEDIAFPHGEPVEIPVEAATLIFGFGEENKLRAIQRLGWAATSNDMQGALERLGKFQFHLEPPGVSTAPHVEDSPAPVAKAPAGGRLDADVAVAGANHTGTKPLLGKLAAAAAGG